MRDKTQKSKGHEANFPKIITGIIRTNIGNSVQEEDN